MEKPDFSKVAAITGAQVCAFVTDATVAEVVGQEPVAGAPDLEDPKDCSWEFPVAGGLYVIVSFDGDYEALVNDVFGGFPHEECTAGGLSGACSGPGTVPIMVAETGFGALTVRADFGVELAQALVAAIASRL